MGEVRGGAAVELLLITDDQPFGSAIVDAIESTEVVGATHIEPATGASTRRDIDDFDGAVVDGQVAEPAAVVEELAGNAGLPVVVLADSAGNDHTIADAIEAGATDVFPRTTASTQCELVVDRIESATQPTTTANGRVHTRLKSERRFRLIADHIDEAVYLSSADCSELLYANSACGDVYGKPVADLSGGPRSFVEAAHPDNRERYQRDIERLVNDIEASDPDDVYEGQYRLERDGETRWVSVARFPVENDDGTVDGIVGRVQDVTERRHIERRFRAILERIDEAIHVARAEELTTPSLHPDDFHAGYEDVWGRPLEEILETHEEGFFGTLHAEDRDGFRSFVADIVEDLHSGTVSDRYSREYRIERADGEVRWIRSDFYPTEWETGPRRIVTVSRDITERKRREREYEQIFNGVQDAITVHDPKTGEMVDANDTFCELMGYDRETILEMGTTGVSVEEEGYTEERAEEVIAEVMSDGQKGPYTWGVETSDGERRVTEVVATRGTIGGEERIISINRDVTERRRREREYEQVFNGVNDSITIHDAETGELLDVNDAFCTLVGHDREEIIENGVMEYTPSGQGYTMEEAKAFIQEVVETDEPKRTEWAIETADGEIRQLEVTGTTVEIGGELRYVAIDRDITERRRREREFEQIFNSVQDTIAVIDPDTYEMVDVNDAFCELVGYDRETVLELGIQGVSVDEEGYTVERSEAIIEEVMNEGRVEPFEWEVETSQGERRVIEVVATTAEIGGETRFLSINRDVTDRKRREQRLEVFNRILRHNLRNQLDVIQSHAELLADRTPDDHAERIVAAVRELAGIGRRARQVDRILSREDALTEVDITRTVGETVETMEPTAGDVAVTTEFPRAARLRTDEETVTMAVESALENALKHAASAVTVAVEERPDECVITISDDGPGIPEEELAPIEAETEGRLQHGRGLGLWQLRWCADKLNAELSFDTKDGTTVRIAVPDRHGASPPE